MWCYITIFSEIHVITTIFLDSMIVLKYEFGDPVPPPGPPDPGPREAFIFISCGGNAPVGAWTYDQYPPKDVCCSFIFFDQSWKN